MKHWGRSEPEIVFLKDLNRVRPQARPSEAWQSRLMSEVNRLALADRTAPEAASAASVFLRFSIASLILAVLVQASYFLSPIDSRLSMAALVQLDPFDVTGGLDD